MRKGRTRTINPMTLLRLSRVIASILALVSATSCRTPELRNLPVRSPVRVDGRRLPTVGLVTYAASVDPAAVSDGTFCRHADEALFRRFFAAPEAVLAEELEQQGYPVTEISGPMASAYPTRVRVSFVGDSQCESRVPLFGSRKVDDCTVRLRVTVTEDWARGPVKHDFERTGLSSIYQRVDAYGGPGPTRAWREAVRDAVRQILADPRAVNVLSGGLARPSRSVP
jgi:hypothetical protein